MLSSCLGGWGGPYRLWVEERFGLGFSRHALGNAIVQTSQALKIDKIIFLTNRFLLCSCDSSVLAIVFLVCLTEEKVHKPR